MEIGSEFWLESDHEYNPQIELPDWIKKFGQYTQLLSTGRGAISWILEEKEIEKKIVLMPSYICESVILPFEKKDFIIQYYEVDKEFKPVELSEIDWSKIGVFLHLGYYGIHTNKTVENYFEIMKSNNVIIIEDVTHTMFSKYDNGKFNDFVIGSIRKWMGIPSGGFVASDKKLETSTLYEDINFISLRTKGLLSKKAYIEDGNKEIKQHFLDIFSEAEQYIDYKISANRIDKTSENIVRKIDSQKIIEKRIKNYNFLYEKLIRISGINPIFEEVTKEVVPMFFPIYVSSDRDNLRKKLTQSEIYCPIHWPIPNQVKGSVTQKTKEIYNSILSIPCDQRYDLKDMKRIVEVLEEYNS